VGWAPSQGIYPVRAPGNDRAPRGTETRFSDCGQELIRRARGAGVGRIEQLRSDGEVELDAIYDAEQNAERMWHSIGFVPEDHSTQESRRNADHAATVNSVKDQIRASAREEIVTARAESGNDPTIVDGVLRQLDARGGQPD
jgi:monovalent cation/hydrogen antiporter